MSFVVKIREYYLKNPKLRAANVKIDYTAEQKKEIVRCSKDYIYFIEKYVKIVTQDQGLIPFVLWPFQKEMLQLFDENKQSIVLSPRQVGKSVTSSAYILWYILFHGYKVVAICADKEKTAKKLLADIKRQYENLPHWIQQGVITWNKTTIELENGSKIMANATSENATRGESCAIVYCDEFSHVRTSMADDFFSSVYPTLTQGKTTKIIVTSTPRGLNHYYKMWMDAKSGENGFKPMEIDWKQVPGRDQEWYDREKKGLGPRKFQQEHLNEFLGSSNTLISGAKLKNMAGKSPIYSKDFIDFHEWPKPDHTYVLSADVSNGKGLDYSAFNIIDVTDYPFRIVAKYRNNKISAVMFPTEIYREARRYNNAYVVLENNDIGSVVGLILYRDMEYENCLSLKLNSEEIGIRQTIKTKKIGCSNLKALIEEDKLIVEDFDCISELSTFIQKRQSYEAEEGYNDDLAMSLVTFAYFCTDQLFKELTERDFPKQLREEKQRLLEQVEDDVSFFGIITDDNTPHGYLDDDDEKVKAWLADDSP